MNTERIDWAELRRQKAWLLAQDADEADGLVNLIDSLQDDAVANGEDEALVFGPDVGV